MMGVNQSWIWEALFNNFLKSTASLKRHFVDAQKGECNVRASSLGLCLTLREQPGPLIPHAAATRRSPFPLHTLPSLFSSSKQSQEWQLVIKKMNRANR